MEEPLTMYELICKEAQERQKIEKELKKIKRNIDLINMVIVGAFIGTIIGNILNLIIWS